MSSSHKLAINGLIALITDEAVKGLNNRVEVKAFRVVSHSGTNRTCAASPSKGDKGLSDASVILGHVIHCPTPTFESTGQGLLGMTVATPMLGAEALKTWVLGMTNSIVEIKLGSKVPLAVNCVLAPDVVCVKREECPVGRHARCMDVKQVHRQVVLRWP
jgi:hypothetical protein